MGGYYAAADGEDEKVAAAIREHYLPRGRDDMPASAGGAALALADKVDTLVGFWSINLKPSGSKDPYGLRRAANGILRILIECGIDLDVKELIDKAAARYKAGDDLKKDLHSYMVEQLCSYDFVQSFSRHAGTGFDRVKAVTEIVMNMENLRPSDFFSRLDAVTEIVMNMENLRPSDFFSRLDAVASFIKDPAADSLIAANKRIWNILKKASGDIPDKPDQDAMTEDAERDLFKAVEDRRKKFDRQFEKRDYLDAMKTLAELREPIDCFFDKVMVMSDNESERNNRLALLTDKVDTLVGFWSINLKPSGSKDPYGLRRAANGILRILIECGIDLDVKELIDKAAARYKAGDDLKKDLHSYMVEQLCSYDFVQSFSRHAGTGFDRVKAVTEIVMNMENLRPSDYGRLLRRS